MAGLGVPVQAQVQPPLPSQPPAPITVTPRDLLPRTQQPQGSVDLPSGGAVRAPAGAERLHVIVGGFDLIGGFPAMARASTAIVAPLVGRDATLADIYAAASAIEAAYARRGYVLARVSVPPQDITSGGKVRLVITDGFVEDIDLAGVPAPVRGAVAASLNRLRGQRQLRLAQIERALLLAGDAPGLALRSTLATGAQAGGTRLIVEGQFRRAGLMVSARNDFAPSLGTWGHSEQFVLNAPLQMGEAFYAFVSGDRDVAHLFGRSARVRVAGGGVLWRLAGGAMTLNPEVTFSRTRPDPVPGAPKTVGVLKRYSLRTGYVLTRRRLRAATASLAVEASDVANRAPDFDVVLSRDHYLTLRAGVQGSWNRPDGRTIALSLQASRGLAPLGHRPMGGAGTNAVPVSREAATFGFTRIEGSASATLPLGQRGRLNVRARGQSTLGEPVFRTEQFALEGEGAITAFVGGVSAVDEGAVARAELGTARALGPLTVAPYLFLAGGLGRIDRPSAAEPAHLRVAAIGGGARAQLGRTGPTLSAEFAEAFSDFSPLDRVRRVSISLGFSI
ncbi:POTRA domain-containing protein [Novosphingobium sp. FKTRR1]|uniref:POTRA domain-containing protein n=1 Tax=Novosphingobium sp. FKTRR1 TaxID=2879118 RepID=UPI001CF06E9E